MRFSTALVALLLLTTATSLPRAAAQYTISTLSVSLGVDGYATVNYGIAADPTTANITLPLIGANVKCEISLSYSPSPATDPYPQPGLLDTGGV